MPALPVPSRPSLDIPVGATRARLVPAQGVSHLKHSNLRAAVESQVKSKAANAGVDVERARRGRVPAQLVGPDVMGSDHRANPWQAYLSAVAMARQNKVGGKGQPVRPDGVVHQDQVEGIAAGVHRRDGAQTIDAGDAKASTGRQRGLVL